MTPSEREQQVRRLQTLPFAIYVDDEPLYVSDGLPVLSVNASEKSDENDAGADKANPFSTQTSGAGKMRAARSALPAAELPRTASGRDPSPAETRAA